MLTTLYRAVFGLLSIVLIIGCAGPRQEGSSSNVKTGAWLLNLDLNGNSLPVNMELIKTGDDYDVTFYNGPEEILVEDVYLFGDSIEMTMPMYDSKFNGRLMNDGTIAGNWTNFLKGPKYVVAFEAIHESA